MSAPVAFKLRFGGQYLMIEQCDLPCIAEYVEQPGDVFTIERVEITREELDNLPDFEGF